MRCPVGLLVALLVFTSCRGSSEGGAGALSVCDLVGTELIESIVGPATPEPFDLPPLFECSWTGEAEVVSVRVEVVPDGRLFVDHAVEATDPGRVTLLEGDLDGGVLFADEAVVVATGNVVVLVDGSVPTSQLIPLAAAAKAALPADCDFADVAEVGRTGIFACR